MPSTQHEVLQVSTEHKVASVGPFSVTMRQAALIAAAGGLVVAGVQLLPALLPVSPTAGLVALLPFIMILFAAAFITVGGRHLDWWAWRKWLALRRPSALVWRHKPPAMERPPADSVQRMLPPEEVMGYLGRATDGARFAVLKVISEPSIALAGDHERDLRHQAACRMLNSADFEFVEMSASREGDVSAYVEDLQEKLVHTLRPEQENLTLFAAQHLDHVRKVVKQGGIQDRINYIIIPYRPEGANTSIIEGEDPLTRLVASVLERIRPGITSRAERDHLALQRQDEAAARVLLDRARTLLEGYESMDIKARLLYDEELRRFLLGQTDPEADNPDYAEAEPITFHEGIDHRLSEEKRRQVIAVAEAARQLAPPAHVTGFHTLADDIAPEAIRVESEYLKIGERYAAVLFISRWPDKLHFGILKDLLTMRGNVRLLKHLTPVPAEDAANLFGRRVAELAAAKETAGEGNVTNLARRAQAETNAGRAMNELIADKQRFFEVTFLVELEAKTREELEIMVRQAKARVARIRARALLCREEMWEAWTSTLPPASVRCAKKYVSKGLLTEALADLQLSLSHTINHRGGIYLGYDWSTSAPIMLDTRTLPNANVIILGTSGVGKTFVSKCITTRLRLQDQTVAVIDSRGDSYFRRVSHAMNGSYVQFGIGSPQKFNPFDLSGYLDVRLLGNLTEAGHSEEEAYSLAKRAAFEAKIRQLSRLLSFMAQNDSSEGALSPEEEGEVDRLLRQTYKKAGITEEPQTHEKTPPIFPDFFTLLAQESALLALRGRLRLWESGSLRHIFDGQTNVELKSKYLAFHIADLEGKEKAAVLFSLLDWLTIRLSDPTETTNCFVDEMWDSLEYPISAKFCLELWRSGRARNNAMLGASQDVEEYLSTKQGRTILHLSETQLIMRQQSTPAEQIGGMLHFSEEQSRKITNLGRGQAHLVVGENVVPLQISASDEETRLFNTDPREERRYLKSESERGIKGAVAAFRTDAGRKVASRIEQEQAGAGGALEHSDEPGRVLSAAGRARRLLASSDSEAAPREEDYEEALTPRDVGDTEGARSHPHFDIVVGAEPLEPATSDDGGAAPEHSEPASDEDESEEDALPEDRQAKAATAEPSTTEEGARKEGESGNLSTDQPEHLLADMTPEDASQAEKQGEHSEDADLDSSGRPRQTPRTDPNDETRRIAGGGLFSIDSYHLPPQDEPARVYAVSGEHAGLIAYNLSGLMAACGLKDGRKVLFVDAEGHVSKELLSGACDPPDPVARGEVEELGQRYVASHEQVGLSALLHPEDDTVPTWRISEAARGSYDVIVVACGESFYAAQWIGESDGGSVTAGEEDLARGLERIERIRGKNGTLVVAMGERTPVPQAISTVHPLFRLPAAHSAVFREAEESADFAVLTDPRVLNPVARLMLTLFEEASGEEAPAATPADLAQADGASHTAGKENTQEEEGE